MALSADQHALLQLTLERGQSYADLVSLLGVEEGEVRARARAALTELAGRDPDRHVALSDYLLGQADPIGRADAVRHLREDPDDLELAQAVSTELRSLFPEATLPRLPGEPRQSRPRRARPGWLARLPGREPARAEEAPEAPAAPRPSLSPAQSRLWIVLASGAILLVALVLAATGAFSGDDGDDTTSSVSGLSEEAVRVSLEPTSENSEAGGAVVFGTATGGQLFIDFDLSGLDPPPEGKAYVAWLLFNERRGHPITPVPIGPNGRYQERVALTDFQVPLAQRARFVDVSLSDAGALNEEIARAFEAAHPIVPYQGDSVLRGAIPRSEESQAG